MTYVFLNTESGLESFGEEVPGPMEVSATWGLSPKNSQNVLVTMS
jgi:hypothetical protein